MGHNGMLSHSHTARQRQPNSSHTTSNASQNKSQAGFPYTDKQKPSGHSKLEFACHFGLLQCLYVYKDNLLSLRNIDMLVCNDTVKGEPGSLVKDLQIHCGADYKEKREAAIKNARPGDIFVCKGGYGAFKWIGHAILHKRSQNETTHCRNVKNIYENIFLQMFKKKSTTLALPLLGAGLSFVYLF